MASFLSYSNLIGTALTNCNNYFVSHMTCIQLLVTETQNNSSVIILRAYISLIWEKHKKDQNCSCEVYIKNLGSDFLFCIPYWVASMLTLQDGLLKVLYSYSGQEGRKKMGIRAIAFWVSPGQGIWLTWIHLPYLQDKMRNIVF